MSQPTFNTFLSTDSRIPESSSVPSGSLSPQPPNLGMTPASRYDHNLRVMRRRDPSVLSIVDQFSHVCLYHHNGNSWEKHGFEGSMFLFERDSYPPYGLYIMNRQGRDDYVQLLYPEDEIVPSERFLIIRSYPDFLEARLKKVASLYPGRHLDKFSDVYAIPNIDELDSQSKGHRTFMGLWTLQDTSRDSLTDVMQRLHTYIRRNEAYPEEYRYGPGRPPPPNRLRALPKKTAGSTSDSQAQRIQSDSENERSYYSDAPNSLNRGLSDIDKLFLKLGPAPLPQGSTITPSDPPKPVSSNPPLTFTGPALLERIFASAPPPHPAPTTNTTIDQPATTVFSPQPSIGITGPQILNSQVLTSMLTGSAPSRASSVVSHPSSREGDNEGGSDSPSTVLDEDSDYQNYRSIRKRGPRINSDLRNGNAARFGQRVNGDVTPRLHLNGLQRASSVTETTSSTSTTRPANFPAPFSVRDASFNPELTPFESESDIWPSIQHSTTTTDDDDGSSDIVELNFEDTSLLSDPDFTKVVKQKKSAVMLRQTDAANGPVRPNGSSSVSPEKVKGKNRRKSNQKKEKEEIEKCQDVPPISTVATRVRGAEKIIENGNPSTSRSLSSLSVYQKPAPATGVEKTPTMSGTMVLPRNGTGPAPKSKGRMNGHASEALNGSPFASTVNPEAIRLSMAQALSNHDQPISSSNKTEFVQQVLRLLQTDESFSERLYTNYVARA